MRCSYTAVSVVDSTGYSRPHSAGGETMRTCGHLTVTLDIASQDHAARPCQYCCLSPDRLHSVRRTLAKTRNCSCVVGPPLRTLLTRRTAVGNTSRMLALQITKSNTKMPGSYHCAGFPIRWMCPVKPPDMLVKLPDSKKRTVVI